MCDVGSKLPELVHHTDLMIEKVKAPVSSKSRGHPKGTQKFRCSSAVAMKSGECHLKKILKPAVVIYDIVAHNVKITEIELQDDLPTSILEVLWGRMKALFTETAYAALQCRLQEIHQIQNICPLCSISYKPSAKMVGCDTCNKDVAIRERPICKTL